MPELPEIESLRRLLELRLCGARIRRAQLPVPEIVRRPEPAAFLGAVCGRTLTGVGRRGKYLLLHLHPSAPETAGAEPAAGQDLIIHLKMQGWLRIEPAGEPAGKYLCAALELEDARSLRLYDMWRWAEWSLVPAGTAEKTMAGLAAIGPEPFDERFSSNYLAERLARRRGPLKPVLLEQRIVAGLGNIYCDECLHRAGLHPARITRDLNGAEVRRLHAAVVSVLQEAVAQGGAQAEGLAAQNANLDDLDEVYTPQIYDRPGQSCPTCGQRLQKFQLRGRGTTFCPHCQPVAEQPGDN